jgi:hypothetical protein
MITSRWELCRIPAAFISSSATKNDAGWLAAI